MQLFLSNHTIMYLDASVSTSSAAFFTSTLRSQIDDARDSATMVAGVARLSVLAGFSAGVRQTPQRS